MESRTEDVWLGLGDRPDLLPHNEDDEMDIEKGCEPLGSRGKIQRLVLSFEFKPKDGVILFISIPFTSIEVEITSGKEVDPSQESIGDEEEFWMVVKRVASALGVEADSQELSGAMDPGNSAK